MSRILKIILIHLFKPIFFSTQTKIYILNIVFGKPCMKHSYFITDCYLSLSAKFDLIFASVCSNSHRFPSFIFLIASSFEWINPSSLLFRTFFFTSERSFFVASFSSSHLLLISLFDEIFFLDTSQRKGGSK